MKNTMRMGFFVVSAVAALSGCNCNPPTPCSDIKVAFTAPEEGAMVTAPFSATIEARDSSGVAVSFDSATLTVGSQNFTGTISGTSATFSGLALAAGSQTLTASIVKGQCSATASGDNKIDAVSRTVTVKDVVGCTPKLQAPTLPQDKNNDLVLNLAELPIGTDAQVHVTAICAAGTTVRLKYLSNTVDTQDFTTGDATLKLPVGNDGTFNLTVELVKNNLVADSTAFVVQVHRSLPACALDKSKLVFGPSDDADKVTTGFQLAIAGTTTMSGASASFKVTGQQMQTVTTTTGTVTATFTLPAAGDTTYTIDLVCTDGYNNTASDTSTARIDYQPPAVAVVSPQVPDGGTATVTSSPLTVVASTDADAVLACAYRNGTKVQCVVVSGGTFSIPVPFSADGDSTIELRVTDAAGNEGATSFGATVTLSGCGLAFTRPAQSPALLTASQLSNGQYTFQTQSKPVCAGQLVSLLTQTVLADGGVTAAVPVGSTTVGATGAANIAGSVTTGSYKYSAVVTEFDAGMSAPATIDVTVDLEGPAITLPILTTGNPYAIVNYTQDKNPKNSMQAGKPGAQRSLQFSSHVPLGGHVDVCTTQKRDLVAMADRTQGDCGPGYFTLDTNVTSPTELFTFPEGLYSIKIVVVGGGVTLESAALPLLVDVTPPCVLASSRSLPQDTNADSRLNFTELGGASPQLPQLKFTLDSACGDTDTSTLATTSPVVVRERIGGVNGTLSGSFIAQAADAPFTSGFFTTKLTGTAAEKDYEFVVQLTDLAGNTSLFEGVPAGAVFPVRIDTVAPACDISTPSVTQTTWNIQTVPGGSFGVTVTTSSDVGTNGVSATFAGFGSPQTQPGTPVAPSYQATLPPFTATGTHAWTIDATCTDSSGNSKPATQRNVTIDLDRPTCSISEPTAKGYTVNSIVTTLTVVGAEGSTVSCTANGTLLNPTLPGSFIVSGGAASLALNYPKGTLAVACSVDDSALNTGSCSVAGNVIVNSQACGLTLTNAIGGVWFNQSNTTAGVATINANTPDCGSMKQVTLVRVTPAPVVAPQTNLTDALGNVSFANITLADNEVWSVTIDNGTGIPFSQNLQVALSSGTGPVTVNTVSVTALSSLSFVAASGNRNVDQTVAGYFANHDADPNSVAAKFDMVVGPVTGAYKFGQKGKLEVYLETDAAHPIVPFQDITSEGQTFTFSNITIPHDRSDNMIIRATDASGWFTNVMKKPIVVDVVPPGAPVVTPSLQNSRTSSVSLQWAPTYDDVNPAAAGAARAHSGYDVRWTTSSVLHDVLFSTPRTAVMDFFGSTAAVESNSAWSASTINRVLTLPPLNTYYFGVRAFDEVGNYSAFTTSPSLTSYFSTLVTLQAPATSTDFGSTIASSTSVTGDSNNDIVVASTTTAGGGAVYVYTGSSSIANQTTCTTGCQALAAPDTAGFFFGSDLSTDGNVADVANEGVADVLVAQRGYPTSSATAPGRVFIFLGTTGASISTAANQYVEIRGDATNNTVGYTARIIKDLNGDAFDEVLITSHVYGGGRGRIYIFKGRTLAQWGALNVSGQSYLLVTSADWIIEADSVFPAFSGTNTSNAMGLNRLGVTTLPGVTGGLRPDGGVIPELVIPTSRANLSHVILFSGQTIANSAAAVPLSVGTGAVSDAGIQTLSQAPYASNATSIGFGEVAWGKQPVTGSGKADLFVGYPINNTVYFYSNWGASGAVGGTQTGTLSGPTTFGTNITGADMNGDGKIDMLISEGATQANGAWLLYQKTSNSFDSPVGGANVRFQVSEFRLVSTGPSKFGLNTGLSDIDGVAGANAGPEIILSDETSGVVRIWR